MIARPAARIFDPTIHLLPWVLQHGLPSPNVWIGGRLAWLGAPAGAGGTLKDAKDDSNDRIRKGTIACALAGNTPAAKTALEALKLKEQIAMTAKILAAAKSGASIHDCISIAPIPVGVPHGPGLVINGSKTVMINGLPACRMGDEILEAFGPKNFIAMGQFNVLIGDQALVDLLAALSDALKKLAGVVQRVAQRLAAIAAAVNVIALTHTAMAMAKLQAILRAVSQAATERANRTLGGIQRTVGAVGKALSDTASEIGQAVASGDPSEIAATVGRKVAEGAKAFNEDANAVVENAKAAARQAIQDERDKMLRGANNIYDKGGAYWDAGMQKLDEMAEDEGLAGAMAREARERAENLARKKRNIEARAEEGYDKAQDARQQAHDGVEQARAKVEDVKQNAERQVGVLASSLADGFDSVLDNDGDHDGHAH